MVLRGAAGTRCFINDRRLGPALGKGNLYFEVPGEFTR
jgi:hypothetical protein